jgi:hypothetical protein
LPTISCVARLAANCRKPASALSAGMVSICAPSCEARRMASASRAFRRVNPASRGVSTWTAVHGARSASASRLAARTSSIAPACSLMATTSRSLTANVPPTALART